MQITALFCKIVYVIIPDFVISFEFKVFKKSNDLGNELNKNTANYLIISGIKN